MSAMLRRIHFWGSLIGMNGVFMPMFIQGLAGANRRLYDGGRSYTYGAALAPSYSGQWWSAVLLGAVQLVFIFNFFWSMRRGSKTNANPWEATSLEWTTTSPPPKENFATIPTVTRSAYEYSTASGPADFAPQADSSAPAQRTTHDAPRTTHHAQDDAHEVHADTGVTSARFGIWLFLASEVMLFGALFSAYALLRVSAPVWPNGWTTLDHSSAFINTSLLVLTTGSWWAARNSSARARQLMNMSDLWALVFLMNKFLEYRSEISRGLLPSTNTFFALYFTLTGLHALHVLGGLIANVWVWIGSSRVSEVVAAGRIRAVGIYWTFVDIVWLIILVLFYLS
jgi:heme/copper-type cytochrome/quinol oxidase subunit 3